MNKASTSRQALDPVIIDHQVDHLILLVGGNPIPNAVAGTLLVRPEGRITLLHSAQGKCRSGAPAAAGGSTTGVAANLEAFFRSRGFQGDVVSLPVHPYDPTSTQPASIGAEVRRIVTGWRGSIGLHYTGGTKAMAVHAYRALEEATTNARRICSYLHPTCLELWFDPEGPGCASNAAPTRLTVRLSLDEMLALHHWRIVSSADEPVIALQAAAQALANANVADAKRADDAMPNIQPWLVWKSAAMNAMFGGRKPHGTPDPNAILNMPAPDDTPIGCVFAALRQAFSMPAGASSISLADAAAASGLTCDEVFGWFDGKWLESIVLDAILDHAATLDLDDVRMNVTAVHATNSKTNFEIDVVAVRGYQLFLLSVTTAAGRNVVKAKLLEAFVRAHQLGGDEASVAIVAPIRGSRGLINELGGLIPEDRARVFDVFSWSKLGDKIAEWIRQQSRS